MPSSIVAELHEGALRSCTIDECFEDFAWRGRDYDRRPFSIATELHADALRSCKFDECFEDFAKPYIPWLCYGAAAGCATELSCTSANSMTVSRILLNPKPLSALRSCNGMRYGAVNSMI